MHQPTDLHLCVTGLHNFFLLLPNSNFKQSGDIDMQLPFAKMAQPTPVAASDSETHKRSSKPAVTCHAICRSKEERTVDLMSHVGCRLTALHRPKALCRSLAGNPRASALQHNNHSRQASMAIHSVEFLYLMEIPYKRLILDAGCITLRFW
jgi:hypothetical protein